MNLNNLEKIARQILKTDSATANDTKGRISPVERQALANWNTTASVSGGAVATTVKTELTGWI